MTSSLSSRHILSDLQKLSTSSFPDNVIQGTSTFNQITLLGIALGIANHAKKSGYKIIVIGFDNRVQSKLFATIVSDLFLSQLSIGKRKSFVFKFDNPSFKAQSAILE